MPGVDTPSSLLERDREREKEKDSTEKVDSTFFHKNIYETKQSVVEFDFNETPNTKSRLYFLKLFETKLKIPESTSK